MTVSEPAGVRVMQDLPRRSPHKSRKKCRIGEKQLAQERPQRRIPQTTVDQRFEAPPHLGRRMDGRSKKRRGIDRGRIDLIDGVEHQLELPLIHVDLALDRNHPPRHRHGLGHDRPVLLVVPQKSRHLTGRIH